MLRLTILIVSVATGVVADDLPTAPPIATLSPATAIPLSDLPPTPTVAPVTPVASAVTDAESEPSKKEENGLKKTENGFELNYKQDPKETAKNYVINMVIVLIFAVIYKSKVVNEYPELTNPTKKSTQLQNENEVSAMFNSCCTTNFFLSWCCGATRAAHTFDKTGTLPFWAGLLAMMLCPNCTLCYTNACTDMNEQLGGEKRNCIMSILCAWCCACCVILQDAESLDAATGARTQCCSVDQDDVEGGSSSAGE